MTPRAVFDAMVYLQGAGSPGGPAAACFDAAVAGLVTLCVSDAGLAEVRDVLTRPRTKKRFPRLEDQAVNDFLARLALFAVRIDPVPAVVALPRDPRDEKHLNLAVAAGAVYLVSRDNDLLDLMTGTDADAVAFRGNHPAIEVLTPPAFLARLAPPAP